MATSPSTPSTARTWRLFMAVWTVVLVVNLVALALLVVSGDGSWWKFVVPAALVVISVTWLLFSARQLGARAR